MLERLQEGEDPASLVQEKWEDIFFGEGEDEGQANCAFCEEHYRWYNNCKGCPIYEQTGEDCRRTPYYSWRIHSSRHKRFNCQKCAELAFEEWLFVCQFGEKLNEMMAYILKSIK